MYTNLDAHVVATIPDTQQAIAITPAQPIDEVLRALRTSATGLTSDEAAIRLRIAGPNEPKLERLPAWKTILPLVADPLVIILFIASIVAAAAGELTDAVTGSWTRSLSTSSGGSCLSSSKKKDSAT
jgi:magnesium-transporting ATPase (P-type)